MQSLEEQMRAASARERELWERVKGKYPGDPEHDERAWREWLESAERVRELGQMSRQRASDSNDERKTG